MPIGQRPRNILEKAVAAIIETDVEHGFVDKEQLAGVSWWINMREEHESSGLHHFHFDSDMIGITILEDPSLTMSPLLSTVTYLSDGGGPTALFPDYDFEQRMEPDTVPNEILLSFPKLNKHLVFNSSLFHGKLAAAGFVLMKLSNDNTTVLLGAGTMNSVGPEEGARRRSKTKRDEGILSSEMRDQIDRRRMTLAVNFWDYRERMAGPYSSHHAQDFREPVLPRRSVSNPRMCHMKNSKNSPPNAGLCIALPGRCAMLVRAVSFV